MLPALVVGVGLVYFFLRDQKAKYPHNMYDCATGEKYVAETEADHQRMADLGYVHKMSECSIDPPQPDDDQFDDMDETTMEEVWSNEDGLVKVWKMGVLMGVRYDNGVDQRRYEYHYRVGNSDGSAFASEATGGGSSKAIQFKTESLAIAYATKEDDSGGSPQKPDDPTPPPPSNPRPSLPDLGGGMQQLSPTFGGM